MVTIEVVYTSPDKQKIISVQVDEETTIERAIHLSGILVIFPEIDLSQQKVGIFGKVKELNEIVKDGDRIEIYRSLLIDPKEARRRKAKK